MRTKTVAIGGVVGRYQLISRFTEASMTVVDTASGSVHTIMVAEDTPVVVTLDPYPPVTNAYGHPPCSVSYSCFSL